MWDAQAHEAQDLRMPNNWATCLVEVTQAGGAAQLGGGKVGEVCFLFVVHVASGGKLCAPFMRFKLRAVSM